MTLVQAMACQFVTAQEVSVEVAQSRALSFLTRQTDGARRAKGKHYTPQLKLAHISKLRGRTCFYVFNVGLDEGFVIIGGDENAREILGYSDHGVFNYDTAPENFKWWIGQYAEQIAQTAPAADTATTAPAPLPAKAPATTTEQHVSVGPLINTKWSQNYPYNCEIPVYSNNGQRYLTGCVATAMAQVMNYWQHPKQGVGSYSYMLEDHEFAADFGATTYDWDHMLGNYSNGYSETEAKAVGTLMYHAGVAVEMEYGLSSSAAPLENIGNALVKYFDYDRSISYVDRANYSDQDWEDLVYDELASGRPILYYGTNPDHTYAHEFICEGYDADRKLFIINWGWGGTSDGYYPLTGTYALSPSYYRYNSSHRIFTNVQPAGSGTNQATPHLFLNHFSPPVPNVYDYQTGSQKVYAFIWVKNNGAITEEFDIAIKAIETKTGHTYYWLMGTGFECAPQGTIVIEDYYDLHDLNQNGTYELHPLCRFSGQDDDSWCELETGPSYQHPVVTVIGADVVNFQLDNPCFKPGESSPIHWNDDYDGTPMFSSSDHAIATVDENGMITAISEGIAIVTAHASATSSYKEAERQFEISVSNDNLMFVQRPYFNNDNNPYDDDLNLYFSIKNVGGITETIILSIIKNGRKIFSNLIAPTLAENQEYAFAFNTNYFKNEYSPDVKDTFYFVHSDNTPWNYPSVAYTYRSKLTVDYSVGASGYGTLILPFNAKLPSGMNVFTCTGVDEQGVLALAAEVSIRRNVPYIVKATPGAAYSFTGPKAIDADQPSFAEGLLIGAVTTGVPLNEGTDYLLQEQDGRVAFFRYMGTPSADSNENDAEGHRLAAPFRAFLRLDNERKARIALPGEETDGIEQVSSDAIRPAGIYSIDGKPRRILQRGLNVVVDEKGEARKVFVR